MYKTVKEGSTLAILPGMAHGIQHDPWPTTRPTAYGMAHGVQHDPWPTTRPTAYGMAHDQWPSAYSMAIGI